MKTKKAKHLDVCHKGCKETHVFCSFPSCGKVGKHFASDHIYVKGVRDEIARIRAREIKKRLIMLAGLGLILTSCSQDRGPRIEHRPGKTVEMMELEGRVRDLERVTEAAEQEKVGASFAKETGLSIVYLPGTNWSPSCLFMAKKGSPRSFYFCGSRLIEDSGDIKPLLFR